MKRLVLPAVIGVVGAVLVASESAAVSLPTSLAPESLLQSPVSDRLSIGASYEEFSRGIDAGAGDDIDLEGWAAYGFVGIDLTTWLTLFGTIGSTALDLEEQGLPGSFDAGVRWSGGLNANIWQYDMREHDVRLSLKMTAEYAASSSEYEYDGVDVTWSETGVALPFGCEVFDRGRGVADGVASLAIYVGPAWSLLDGDADEGGGDGSFDGTREFGVAGGVDIRVAECFSIGAQAESFDGATVRGSVRYHF